MPSTIRNFEGVGQGFTGPQGAFTVDSAPPDTNGDVGPNHFVQIVNESFAVFSRTGTVLYGPVSTNTIWSGFGGGCQTNNDGDAVVKYDKRADRWIFSQFSVSTTPYRECLAVSKTGDPTGAYNRYSYTFSNFPDYPKLAIWPDGYYVTYNMFNGNSFVGGELCAYDRSTMLTGGAATQQCFTADPNMGGSLPSDLDGPADPPADSPDYVLAFGTNSLQLWEAHVDWASPGSSTLTGPTTMSAAAFSAACGGGACVPQPGTSNKLDSLADRVMYRLAYRNFSDHESLVVNHSVTPSGTGVGVSGVRWYEIRSPGSSPSIFQQGTFAPGDGGSRWMGSVAMDGSGDIAMGYSVSSGSIPPSIRYTGRLAGDPLGTMPQGESSIQVGSGSQKNPLNRWGDYSSISVDPVDDCTFWYTNEYLTADGTFNWQTRIGTFKFPSCGCATTPTAAASGSAAICAGQSTALSGSGGVSCSWSPATGLSNASTCTPNASPSSTTTYTLRVTDADGCSSTNDPTVTITVNAKPTPVISPGGPTTFCQGGSVMLDAGAGYISYLWSPGGATTQKIAASSSGSYSVTVVNASGCSGTSSPVTVTVNPMPTALASGSTTICAGQSTNLSGSGSGGAAPYSCSWSPATGLSNASSCVPSATPSATTMYSLTVTDAHGCSSTNIAAATVTVAACSVAPAALSADPSANGISSDGDGLIEPNEAIRVDPSWTNDTSGSLGFTGTLSSFTGPGNGGGHAAYSITDASADYGTVSGGATSDCHTATGNCYTVSLTLDAPANRPSRHWDTTVQETLSTGTVKTWTLHVGDSFGDISRSNVFYPFVETLFHNGITQGGGSSCTSADYCPTESTRRDQMTAFVARSLDNGDSAIPVSGPGYDCSDVLNPTDTHFLDTPPGSVFCRHANLLFIDDIVFGCGGGELCAGSAVSRGEMAIIIARTLQFNAGHTINPDGFVPTKGTDGAARTYDCSLPPNGFPFPDVQSGSVFCKYVGDIWVRHVVDGFPDGTYGPTLSIRRDEAAKILVKTFVNAPLYRP